MKTIIKTLISITVLFAAAFIFLNSCNSKNQTDLPDTVFVKYVIDGDTFVGDDKIHYRLIGIDTPELAKAHKKAQPFAKEAKDFTYKAISGKKVFLAFENDVYDKYNRRLAYVYVTKQHMLNEMLLKEGLARVYRKQNFAFKQRFFSLQNQAKSRKIGLWMKIKRP